ncbi:MAG TPA: phosphodiester glycosidase family protein [Chitinophagaceae bacterium]|nr:phosphodiester glycosidase family protein [Chitinophagaceae bacterium]
MKKILLLIVAAGAELPLSAQVKWINVDSFFGPLPPTVHVYKTTDSLDGKPNIAYYLEADMKNRELLFTTDTTYRRRMTPAQFYRKNNDPLLVVNTTFFSFATNQNLNLVIKNGKLVSYNVHTLPGRGKDTLTYRHPLGSAIGISSSREADIAWLYTDSSRKYAYALQTPIAPLKDSVARHRFSFYDRNTSVVTRPHKGRLSSSLRKWDMKTAVGGGPVLVQYGQVRISNNEELKFAGKAIHDRHPRTAMGYTKDQKLIILVVEGRNPGRAEGATLVQLAQLFRDIGCWEALNLDGGGSSCMLVNGKETIKVSDPGGQRPVPAVFLIKHIPD